MMNLLMILGFYVLLAILFLTVGLLTNSSEEDFEEMEETEVVDSHKSSTL